MVYARPGLSLSDTGASMSQLENIEAIEKRLWSGLPVDSYVEEEVSAKTVLVFRHVFQSMPEPLGFGTHTT